jgi:hypothetical protein
MSQFTLTSSSEDFANLQADESNYRPQGPNNQKSPGEQALQTRDVSAQSLAQSAAALASMTEEDRKIQNAYTQEQTNLLRAKIENSPKTKRALRVIESREKNKKAQEDYKAKREADSKAFWARNSPGAMASDMEARDKAWRERIEEKVKPIREAKLAKEAAEKQRQKDMADPAKRLEMMKQNAARDGVQLNYAEVGGNAPWKPAAYMADTPEGRAGYERTRGTANQKQVASAANQASGRAAGMMTPQIPQKPATGAPAGAMAATNAMAAATPKPATPGYAGSFGTGLQVTPRFNPTGGIVGPINSSPTRPAAPTAAADPNAAAAIASFNQSVSNMPKQNSPAQQANLRNLQQGDNVPTMADVPGEIAKRTGNALGAAGQAVANSTPVQAAGNVLSGKTPLISTTRPDKVSPTRPAPRLNNQTAAQKPKNSMLVN